MYYLLFTLFWLLSLLPLSVLYIISDIFCFIVYRIVKYRVKLVRKHLADSFPEKGEEERRKIEKQFYQYLCDQFVEGIKLMTCSKKYIRKHLRFEGIDEISAVADKGQSIAAYLGHYGCWDWITSLPLWTPANLQCAQIYHVLENEAMDKVYLYIRTRMGAQSITMNETLRQLIKYNNDNQRCVVGFIADQVPFWNNIHHWRTFLNHPDTPVLTGTERIVKKLNFACFYIDVTRPKRGYYIARFIPLTDEPQKYPDYEITDMYFDALERNIRREPQYWLWTHNRWKRTREQYNKIIDLENHKMKVNRL
ncbi:MAG: lysophospholipid acyltransferase family protein [Bacteroidaceae bacterium]|nr:lysophospholipid acyltransferase family protein [Bacteroidaceae bacterium]